MKALSLKQPWLNWVILGLKRYETRTWSTPYRGPLLLCASKRADYGALIHGMGIRRPGSEEHPAGVALATCRLDDVRPMTPDDEYLALCPYEPGRLVWELRDVRSIEPFPVKGMLGLFEVAMPTIKPEVPDLGLGDSRCNLCGGSMPCYCKTEDKKS